ncbi:CYTH and CHAD domain-containing protein [Actinotalea sp. BY-33]|uniref:CYTH and CHAD domain-containing protein n=1 Tax=Actinotalea soli TaxID=2819234 RepID=A0A939LQF9_9CELL|nr:CYTH and CHAD domain-containing protein [Actinotalea soli]MBO1752113.1 CYTH and CHAD domain-containing protein [Actinotalea soli]
MAEVHREVETKYEVVAELQLPDLVELFGSVPRGTKAPSSEESSWAEEGVERQRLRATYFDTADFHLAAAGLTLRRRTGGSDAGWHLKVPMADGSRSEIRLPLGRGATTVPARLVAMLYAVTDGRELVPVVKIDTDRTVRHLVDEARNLAVEVADDLVTTRPVPSSGSGESPPATSWREIEVELVDGPTSLLDSLDPVLRASGLVPARTTSKLARALGRGSLRAAGGTTARKASTTKVAARTKAASGKKAASGEKARAGEVALAYIGAQVDTIRAQDMPVRLDAEGSVHAMRVATRRLRSALTTLGPLLDRKVTKPLGTELRWLARVLGEARDAEVMRARIGAAVDEERPDARLDPAVAEGVDGELDSAYRAAHDDVVAQLSSDRYRALLDALRALVEHPPLTDRAGRSAQKVLPGLVAKSDARVGAAMRAAHTARDEAERETQLHRARKAAKKARYSAESVASVFGKDARRFAAAMEEVQEALGDHLDAVATRARLRELASGTEQPGTAFTYGRLHALEEARAQRSGELVGEAWAAARKKKLRAWLR